MADSFVFMDDGCVVECGDACEVLANAREAWSLSFLQKVL
jgi:polar amino acid transport system ATP-binding protein